ncbi:hypothetical protein QZH41_006401 [Actinostola sp. cb2023]|nr:hypothetical protein QZH41_006401 [Actinostola sp. cb2023]
MDSTRAEIKCGKSLDDSLTNIQWLCGLESSGLLLQSRENSVQESRVDVMCPNSPNPYPKPPYSYATMILLAINSTEDKKMTLQDIYKWIENNYPYYKKCKKAWKHLVDIYIPCGTALRSNINKPCTDSRHRQMKKTSPSTKARWDFLWCNVYFRGQQTGTPDENGFNPIQTL